MFWLLWLSSLCSASIVYLIRHAEKPASGNNLNDLGYLRAECLAERIFAGPSPEYAPPTHIIAQPSNETVRSERSVETLVPLAKALNLSIEQPCTRDEIQCVVDILSGWKEGPVLVVWQHSALAKILKALISTSKKIKYPKHRFDVIWVVDTERKTFETKYQSCPGLD